MRRLVADLRRRLGLGKARRPPVAYAVTCPAGHPLRGWRKKRHQVVSCEQCGQPVFILPYSPLPPPDGEATADRLGASPLPASSRPWRLPLIGGAITLSVVAAGFAVLFSLLRSPREAAPADARQQIEAGKLLLAEGKPRRAVETFDEAIRLARQGQPQLTASEGHQLHHWRRQAGLAADLLSESLGEILLRAARTQPDEWQDQFGQRYKGQGKANAVVFDAGVRRDAAGQYQLDWVLRAGAEHARIDLGDLSLLRTLPLDQPRRLLFGARLASVAREAGGVWLVRFEPDSGVLLTDREAAEACCPGLVDAEMQELLARQREWLEGK